MHLLEKEITITIKHFFHNIISPAHMHTYTYTYIYMHIHMVDSHERDAFEPYFEKVYFLNI